MKKLFVTLTLVLATFTFAQEHGKPMRNMEQMKQKQQEHLDKMKKDLNLTPAQVQQIKALQDKRFSEMEAMREKNKEERKHKMHEMMANKKAHEEEMKKILTPEQYEKWLKQRDEHMPKNREMMKEKRTMPKPEKTTPVTP